MNYIGAASNCEGSSLALLELTLMQVYIGFHP